MNVLNGYKTYLAAAGLFGLAIYQFSQGNIDGAIQSALGGLTALGLRSAIAKAA